MMNYWISLILFPAQKLLECYDLYNESILQSLVSSPLLIIEYDLWMLYTALYDLLI